MNIFVIFKIILTVVGIGVARLENEGKDEIDIQLTILLQQTQTEIFKKINLIDNHLHLNKLMQI